MIFRRQTYVGRIKFSQFDTVSTAKKIIVATEENVLAALNLKTGKLILLNVSVLYVPNRRYYGNLCIQFISTCLGINLIT